VPVQGRRFGSALERQFINFAFSTYPIDKLNCEVIAFNDSVVALHGRLDLAAKASAAAM